MTIQKIQIRQRSDIAAAWEAGRELGKKLGLSDSLQSCLAWAIREITRKALMANEGGTCLILDQSDPEHLRIRIQIADQESDGISISTKRA